MHRIHIPRPAHATVVAYVALFVAMSGTAVAATGGSFVLGRANTASKTSTLTSRAGAPLSLVAPPGRSPLRVSSARQVSLLNGDHVGTATDAQIILGLDPYRETALTLLMKAHLAAGNPAHALAAYEELRVGLAKVLRKQGRTTEARQELRAVLDETAPANPAEWSMRDAPEARALLQAIGP